MTPRPVSKVPVAPWEVASSPLALRKGNYLYYLGKKYRCPELIVEEQLAIIADIRQKLEPYRPGWFRRVKRMVRISLLY